MSEAAGERFLLLEELGPQPDLGRVIPASWRYSFARIEEDETLCWAFHSDDAGSLPAGYLDSLLQRHEELAALMRLSRVVEVSLEEAFPEGPPQDRFS